MKPRMSELGDKNLIGRNVARLRRERRMTQKVLMAKMQALGADINYTSLSKLEGQTRMASDKEALALSKIFGISIDEMVSGNGTAPDDFSKNEPGQAEF